MKKISKYILILLIPLAVLFSCETEDHFYDGPEMVSFSEGTSGFMFVLPSGENVFTIQVGATTMSNTDRVIKLIISPESTAISGVHFNAIANSQVIIPAGSYIGILQIHADFSGFTDNNVKNLVIKISDEYKTLEDNQFTVSMQRMCPLNLSDFVGAYNVADHRYHRNGNGWRDFTYEASIELVSGQDNKLKIINLGNYGGEVIVNLDISKINQIPISMNTQTSGYDPELFNETNLPFGNVTYRDQGGSLIYVCDGIIEINLGTVGSPGFYSMGTATFTHK